MASKSAACNSEPSDFDWNQAEGLSRPRSAGKRSLSTEKKILPPPPVGAGVGDDVGEGGRDVGVLVSVGGACVGATWRDVQLLNTITKAKKIPIVFMRTLLRLGTTVV
jgi:hypothetical protein